MKNIFEEKTIKSILNGSNKLWQYVNSKIKIKNNENKIELINNEKITDNLDVQMNLTSIL